MNFTIRPPRQSEWPICRMLIPNAFKTNGTPDFRLAVQEASPHIIGAAAFLHVSNVMHSVMVHVVPTYRRQRIGTALLDHLITEAREKRERELSAMTDITSDPAVETFLLSNGFVHKEILYTCEGDLEPLYKEIMLLREQMVNSGTIHSAARIAPVDESNREQALQLYADYIARNRHVPIPLLKLGPADLMHSRALMIEDRVEGMLLGNVEGSIGRVAAMVVTPPYRHGWAAVLLMAASLESAWAAGARRVQFDFLDSNIDMHNVHLKAETVRVLVSFVRPLKDE